FSLVFSNPSASASSYDGINCGQASNSMTCMVCNCFFEARGESYKGKLAVGQTVMTRVFSNQYHDRVCDTVYEGGQFSWTNDGLSDQLPKRGQSEYDSLQQCVNSSIEAYNLGPNGYTHYHADWASPRWSRSP